MGGARNNGAPTPTKGSPRECGKQGMVWQFRQKGASLKEGHSTGRLHGSGYTSYLTLSGEWWAVVESKGCSSREGFCIIYAGGGLHSDSGRGCRRCLELSLGAGTGSRPACRRCAQVEDLLQQVAKLQEVVRGLCSIGEAENKLDSCFQAWLATEPQPNAPSRPHRRERGAYNEGEWKLAMARTQRRKTSPKARGALAEPIRCFANQ